MKLQYEKFDPVNLPHPLLHFGKLLMTQVHAELNSACHLLHILVDIKASYSLEFEG